jgi:hypothetical protein
VHAALRRAPQGGEQLAPAWREQCYAIAVLAPAAVLLNWLTTGDHLVATLRRGYWPVAGLDLVLLVTAFIALYAAGKLRRREVAALSRSSRADDASLSGVQEAHG